MFTTTEAAERLGVTVQRVHQLIQEETLPAQRMGRDYFINEVDLKLAENRPKVGRPPKPKAVETPKASKKGNKK